jgi:hypothetical protein
MVSQTSPDDAALLALVEENDQLQAELDSCRWDHNEAIRQLHVHKEHTDALQEKISMFEKELRKQHGTLRQEIEDLSRELAEVELYNQASIRHDLAQMRYLFHNSPERQNELRERELLFQRIEGLEREAQKWRYEAFGRGNVAISRCWKTSVNDALRRERKKDSWVIKHLQDEVQTLRAENLAGAARREAECETREGKETLLATSLRAEIELLKGYSGNSTSARDTWQRRA